MFSGLTTQRNRTRNSYGHRTDREIEVFGILSVNHGNNVTAPNAVPPRQAEEQSKINEASSQDDKSTPRISDDTGTDEPSLMLILCAPDELHQFVLQELDFLQVPYYHSVRLRYHSMFYQFRYLPFAHLTVPIGAINVFDNVRKKIKRALPHFRVFTNVCDVLALVPYTLQNTDALRQLCAVLNGCTHFSTQHVPPLIDKRKPPRTLSRSRSLNSLHHADPKDKEEKHPSTTAPVSASASVCGNAPQLNEDDQQRQQKVDLELAQKLQQEFDDAAAKELDNFCTRQRRIPPSFHSSYFQPPSSSRSSAALPSQDWSRNHSADDANASTTARRGFLLGEYKQKPNDSDSTLPFNRDYRSELLGESKPSWTLPPPPAPTCPVPNAAPILEIPSPPASCVVSVAPMENSPPEGPPKNEPVSPLPVASFHL